MAKPLLCAPTRQRAQAPMQRIPLLTDKNTPFPPQTNALTPFLRG